MYFLTKHIRLEVIKKLLKFAIICGSIYYLFIGLLSVYNEELRKSPKIYLWSNLSMTPDLVCRLPLNIDPLDVTVNKFLVLDEIRRIACVYENETFDWTYVDDNGILRMNSSLSEETSCEYQVYRRYEGDDNKNEYMEKGVIDKNGFSLAEVNQSPENRFVKVECLNSKTNKKYKNNHYWFEPNLNKFPKKSGGRKPSVLILVIESLSRINYLRHMSLTKKALESLGNVFYLNGLTKMADNSHPNMVPFLTGFTVEHFGGRYDKGPFDDYPFIWKKYQNSGYTTAFMEDHYDITLFNEMEIGRKGFVRSQPVDWYTLPFWRHLETTDEPVFEDYCYFDRIPRVEIFLNQLSHFVKRSYQKSLPYFAFAFYIRVTHVRFNNARILDSHYANLINRLKQFDIQNDFLILMGDHGCRFNPDFLQTTIGRIEERMPLFGIHIPDSILASNPHLAKNLITNRDRLTNWLDIHLMLNDILNNNYSSISTTDYKASSYSLWRQQVPQNRTCSQALIPQLYCVCDERKQVDTRDQLVLNVSLFLVKHINNLLPQKCHQLFLRDVIRVEEIILRSSVTSNHIVPNVSKLFEVTVLLNPSQAIIRSQIELFNNKTVKINEEMTRLNRYGNQSYCVNDSLLRKLCLCKV